MKLSWIVVCSWVNCYCLIPKIYPLKMLFCSFSYRPCFSKVIIFFFLWGSHEHRSELLGNKAKLLLRKTKMEECMVMIKKCMGSADLCYCLSVSRPDSSCTRSCILNHLIYTIVLFCSSGLTWNRAILLVSHLVTRLEDEYHHIQFRSYFPTLILNLSWLWDWNSPWNCWITQ